MYHSITQRRLTLPALLAATLTVLGLAAPAARATTRTVSNRNDTGAGSLRAVVAASAAGDTITFSVTGTITLTSGQIILGQPVTIQGPGAGALAIDGNHNTNILVISATSGTVTISGLTIQNSGDSALLKSNGGTALTVTACRFTGNTASVGGGIYSGGGTMTLTNCVFSGNHASSGGGVQAAGNSRATVTGCVFTGNTADAGGGYYNLIGQSTLTNCIFTGNSTSGYGGGFFSNTATSTLTGCSFTGNTGGGHGGALSYFNSATTLTDDIFYGDSASSSPEIWLYSGAAATVTYCDVQGGATGTGNFSADPGFVSDTAPYNLLVRPGSPVVGAGVPVTGLTTDITGAARPDPPTVGAYEGTQAQTTPMLASSLNPSAVGQGVTFTVTVGNVSDPSGFVPAGTVSLSGLPGGPVSLGLNGNGQAFYTTSTLPLGSYPLSAAFTPADDSRFAASRTANPALTQRVVGAPTANAQSVSVAFNTARAITLTGSDPNTPPLSLTYAVVTSPAHGSLSGTAPNLTYTPTTGYHGTDAFTFTVNNGVSTSSPATVTLTVAAGVPTANAQSVSVAFNTAKAVMLTGSDPDVPTLPLTYTVTNNPTHGTLSGTAPNLTYTPAGNYTGTDSFQFKISNGTNTSAAATVSLTVNPVFLASLTFPTPVEGGSVLNGTVTLSGVTPTDVVVGPVYQQLGDDPHPSVGHRAGGVQQRDL